MASLVEIKQLFFVECEEQLEQLNDGLSEISELSAGTDPDPETINTMFRAVHSVKGGAASFSLDAIVRFSHVFESILDEVRSGELKLNPEIVQIFFRGADYLSDLISLGAVGDLPTEADLTRNIEELNNISEKNKSLGRTENPQGSESVAGFQPVELNLEFENFVEAKRNFIIKFVPTCAFYENGHEPVYLFRELESLSELSISTVLDDSLPWDKLEPAISWILKIETDFSESEIREIFEFAEVFAEIDIDELHDGDVDSKSNPIIKTKRILDTQNKFPKPQELNALYEIKNNPTNENKSSPKTVSKSTVRVDLDLVDDLINMVGELVITQSVMTQSILESDITAGRQMTTTLEEFKTLTRQIQEGVMAIRAQSVKPLFQRMGRIVRETAQIANKEVRFLSSGEDTEVDRTVIERLVDPLTHIIRNAIDHGLEPADARVNAGKEPVGAVTLSAAHRSGRVVIEVKDDGGGVDREKVLASAIQKGIVLENANLSPSEIDWLLFTPGFSTASAVTNLSGRGVGMDVVNNEIRRLGGRVSIISTQGLGTTISISLPLTLAVLDGMIVDVAGQTMVIPISAIVETIRPQLSQLHWIGPSARMITVRDVLIPIIELGDVFGQDFESALDRDGVLLLVEDDQGEQCALAVDRIYDQRQVVIKSLESNYGHVPYIAAATILGDGQIALILDLDEITHQRPGKPSMPRKTFGVSA